MTCKDYSHVRAVNLSLYLIFSSEMSNLNAKFCAYGRFEMIDTRFQILIFSALDRFEEPEVNQIM